MIRWQIQLCVKTMAKISQNDMRTSTSFTVAFFLCISLSYTPIFHVTADHESSNAHTSILFATLGRSNYAFDIYALSLWDPPSKSNELRLTDGNSVNFNGHFPSSSTSSSLFSLPPNQTPYLNFLYVTERNGTSSIYLDALYYNTPDRIGGRSILEAQTELSQRIQVPLVGGGRSNGQVSMKDKPALVGGCLIYVSTHENPGVPRASWTAVYSTQLKTGFTRRLTPYGIADFSPSVSPSGLWTAVASYGAKGWDGDVEELETDIYVFLTEDGSTRVKVVEHGGWPIWMDDSTLYFHRRSDDGWWSVYRAILPSREKLVVDSVVTARVTPPGLHAFTPAASIVNKSFIAVATRRFDSQYRHIELYDVVSKQFRELTKAVSPNTHHFNPFISPDSTMIGYHRCRGVESEVKSEKLLFENVQNQMPGISLFRVDGTYPSFSPTGDRIAYVSSPGLYVVNSDGSAHRKVHPTSQFTSSWDPKRKGVVYTSVGPTFASEDTKVDIISVNVDNDQLSYQKLTTGGENNAFPWPSPDGKWIVFRSGRSGHKNLFIMDAIDGEKGGIRRLTKGPWTDTMCNWSPNRDWIAFASDRDNPGSGSFSIYLIHPNGTGLRKLVQSGSGGRANHPYFSPDGNSIVFTTDYAGVSAEPISLPHHYQPYGDIFTINLDGSDLRRLTHNSFEDGTPAWGSKFMRAVDVPRPNGGPQCAFEDCHWLSITPNPKFGTQSTFTGSATIQCAH